jgi:diguanylate cyclase (GGDEF)-like protein
MLLGGLTLRRRLAVLALQAFILAGLLAYSLSTLLRSSMEEIVVLDWWLNDLVAGGATVLCLARGALVRRERWAWLCIGVGLAVWLSGNVVWWAWVRVHAPDAYPSVADALWLGFYPFFYIGLVLLVRQRVVRFHPSIWLDGVVGGLGAAAVSAALAFETILAATGGTAAAVMTNLAYPIADLLLVVMIVGVFALLGWRPERAWWLLATGMAVFATVDIVYLFQVARDTYVVGTWLDALWPAAAVLVGLAAWQPPARDRPHRLEGWAVLVVPSLFAVGALAVLVLDHFQRVSTLAVVLATVTVLAAVVRAGMTFREVRSLADSRRQAQTDELTGLGNRRLVYTELEAALLARRDRDSVALLILDLDRFKEINDALGHHIGDRLLRLIGSRLADQLHPDDVLARLGGDEFAVLLRGADGDRATAMAARLLAALQAPIDLEGIAVHVDASVGIAVCPDHATDPTTLLQRADVAMYQAKSARSGWQLYAFHPGQHGRDRLQTIQDLRTALDQGQLLLHYQPKLDLRTGTVAGVEALVRWRHPGQGLLYPDTFLPLAEQTGLMRSLTSTVLQTALGQARSWRHTGLDISVAVNLSVANLIDTHLPAEVGNLLTAFGLPASALELEITETTLMVDPVRSAEVLGALRALGVRIAVDDYGTGYSSLAYLQQLAVDELKLDKSFVLPMLEDPAATAIVRTTVDLAHSLGLTLVAEGVESQAHLRELARLGCDLAQGYHLSRPLPPDDLTPWLQQRTQPPTGHPTPASGHPTPASGHPTVGADQPSEAG